MEKATTGFMLDIAEFVLTLFFVALAMISLEGFFLDNGINPLNMLLAGYTLMGILVAKIIVRAFLFGKETKL